MTQTADVVVVGGGAIGASIAYHLAAAGAGRIVLLEREQALGTGSTGALRGRVPGSSSRARSTSGSRW